jgi:hypothetical protein
MSELQQPALRPIVAHDQVRLGAGRGLRLALSGMAYRLFRSSVTIAILALATAFLMHMLSYGLLENATERHAYEELSRQRQLGQAITRLSDVDPEPAIIDALASKLPERLAEYSHWSTLGDAALDDAVAIARRLRDASLALRDYPVAARAVLYAEADAQQFILRLSEGELGRLDAQLRQLGLRAPLGGMQGLRRLVIDELPRLQHVTTSIQQGQQRAISELSQSFAGKTVGEVLRQPTPELAERLRGAGYQLSPADLVELSRLEQRTGDLAMVAHALQNGEVIAEVSRAAAVESSKVNFETLCAYVTHLDRARLVRKWLVRAGVPESMTADRLLELTAFHVREKNLARVLGSQAFEPGKVRFGLSERNLWLVVLSFLVCIVGVANAMLMSVTERFTEIATMKCLGAMDGFVMMMFVLEAVIQGAAGGVVGLVVGLLLAVLRAAVAFGTLLVHVTGVVGPILAATVVSLVASVVLAAMAAIGPAWLAARLSPMEAMRVE